MLRKSSIHSERGKYQGHNTIAKGIEKGCHNKRSTKAAQQQQKKCQFQSFSFAIEKKRKENNKRTQTKLEQCTSIYSLNAATKCFTPSASPFPPCLHFPDSPTELITKLVQSRACFLDFGCCCREIFFICMEIESASKRTYKKIRCIL